jgi:hypothetical protein
LNTELVRRYEEDGLVFPLPVLSAAEVHVCLDAIHHAVATSGEHVMVVSSVEVARNRDRSDVG